MNVIILYVHAYIVSLFENMYTAESVEYICECMKICLFQILVILPHKCVPQKCCLGRQLTQF